MSDDNQLDLFDLDNLDKEVYTIGRITNEITDLLGLTVNKKEILMWKDRFTYIEKHKNDFDSEEQYIDHVKAIPDVLRDPEYVGIHPNGNSIEFIKKIDKNLMIAVRINNKGNLVFRTSYPIKDSKLNNYISSGRVKKVK
ncbi:PBECR2 nuclease fold domain-containing protein [Lysinibacillus sp. 1 U-2021]|uniref:PBECR3 domain-containing polyvalent protein n=1 Tax=Lysinibacillus sp. 1 U-2021 TaxID=3039426 RepID=UPI002480F482|nr:PBECR2 nuclease fold domain-containing protein [Lysinibacillus sp. 1 U-2021]WGT37997.1 PBECR2 nuclease fold domain-containing protein [Lysinibacillus sp. 1 U-2021]